MASMIGTRWRFRPVGGGTFHCPRCDRERDYTGTDVRPTLALFGRPVLPIGHEQTLIACDACGAIYDAGVTSMSPEAARGIPAEDDLALEAVLTAMVFSDSTVRPAEKEVAREAARHYTHRAAGAQELSEALLTPRRPTEPFDRLARLAGLLHEDARRRILAAAYRVCAADRELHPQEARLLMQLGEVLELHPRQVRQAMKEGRT